MAETFGAAKLPEKNPLTARESVKKAKKTRKRKPAKVHHSVRLSPLVNSKLSELERNFGVSFSVLVEHLIIRGLWTTRWAPLDLTDPLDDILNIDPVLWGGCVERFFFEITGGDAGDNLTEAIRYVSWDLEGRARTINKLVREGKPIPKDPIDLYQDRDQPWELDD